ncbi:Nudix hydrolase 3 [Nymphaea thermarum]|nr:Nudix hydrolase 3 [Nymphaea thermarum]
MVEELLDVLTHTGQRTGISKPRGLVHKDGDYHRAVHVWIFAESTKELLLQRRADCKDSWPGLWDISSAGHISAGDTSLITARRELEEELGVKLPEDAFELIFEFLQECVINDGTYTNNEFNDVYLVTTLKPIPLSAFTLQESEVSAVKYIPWEKYKAILEKEDPEYVPYDISGIYGKLFSVIEKRYKEDKVARSLMLQKQLDRYASITLDAELSGLSKGDMDALVFIIKAAKVIDEIFYSQVWASNPTLRDWLKEHAVLSSLDRLKWENYSINKSPWSVLDENGAFLSTADSAVKLSADSTRSVPGWEGVEYRAAFPIVKPAGANFYPPDMDKKEFELWKNNLRDDQQEAATGFFTVIRRPESSTVPHDQISEVEYGTQSLCAVPYPHEYQPQLHEAANFLKKAERLADSPSLKQLLRTKAEAFLSNDYFESDIAWMQLVSELIYNLKFAELCFCLANKLHKWLDTEWKLDHSDLNWGLGGQLLMETFKVLAIEK